MSLFSLAVFASGKGSNCQAIQQAIEAGQLRTNIRVVISNKSDAEVLEWARKKGIPAFHLSSEQFDTLDGFYTRLLTVLREYEVDMIVLAGYLKKIGKPLLAQYPGRVVNIHPALLPAFGGKGMFGHHVHEAVIEYGARITGVTIHLVDEEYDRGPIVMQKAIEVRDDDTPETLATRVLTLEHETYVTALQLFADDRIEIHGRWVSIKKESVVP